MERVGTLQRRLPWDHNRNGRGKLDRALTHLAWRMLHPTLPQQAQAEHMSTRTAYSSKWLALLLVVAVQAVFAVGSAALYAEDAPHFGPSAQRLIHDVDVLVAGKSQRGWEIDRLELEALLGAVLESVCRTAVPARGQAQRWAQSARDQVGGPLPLELAKHQGDLDALAGLVVAERRLRLLEFAIGRAPSDCPQTIRPQRQFLGRQTLANRTVVHLDGGGLATLRTSRLGQQFGGGGSGRLMVGHGWSPRWAWFTGAELGGAALLDPLESDQQLKLHLYFAWPAMLRWTRQQFHIDVDAAPVLQLSADGDIRGLGARTGLMAVVSTARLLSTIPYAGIGVSFEKMMTGAAGAADEWTIRAGFRVGFDWDLGATGHDRQAWREQATVEAALPAGATAADL